MSKDLRKKGLYYSEDIKSALSQFRDRIPHDLIVIDGKIISALKEDLKKNLIKLSNRILVIYEKDEEKKEIEELISLKKIVAAEKNEIGSCNGFDELYNKMRLLWIQKFFNVPTITLCLCNLKELAPKWRYYNKEKEYKEKEEVKKIINNKIDIIINCSDSSLSIDLTKEIIIIDHHYECFDKIEETFLDKSATNFSELCLKHFYYEPWDKGSYLSFIFNSPPQNENEFIRRILEFVEMGLLKVIILDERIAEKATTEEIMKKGLFLWKMLNLQQVYVVTHLVKDGKEMPISPAIKEKGNSLEIKRENNNFIIMLNNKKVNNNFQCFIGHKTLVNNPEFRPYLGIESTLEEWIGEMERAIPIIILDSGRGEVDIPQNAKFLPYSYLEEMVIRNTNKYRLTNHILRLTRTVQF